MEAPKTIYLSPACGFGNGNIEILWCQDDHGPCEDCGAPAQPYVRRDVVDGLLAALKSTICYAKAYRETFGNGMSPVGNEIAENRIAEAEAVLAKAEPQQ